MADNGLAPQPPAPPPGRARYDAMAANAGQPIADEWKAEKTSQLMHGGFTGSDVDAYFGEDQPATHAAAPTGIPQPKTATNALEAFSSGWDMSVTGLTANLNARNLDVTMHGAAGDRPMVNTVLPQDASLLDKVLHGVGQGIGDLPFQVAGMVATPAAGGMTSKGAVASGGTEALRQLLITAYNFRPPGGQSPIQNFRDFSTAYGSHLSEIGSQTVAGGLGAGLGGIAGEGVSAFGGGKVVGSAVGATTMAVTSTAVGGAMSGKMPDAQDFTAGAIMALGFEAAGYITPSRGVALTSAGQRIAHNLQQIYVAHGITPADAINLSHQDPAIRAEILAQDPNGDPVTPRLGASREPEPAHYKPPEPNPQEPGPAFGRRPNAAVGGEPPLAPTHMVANSVDEASHLLVNLEGSADNAVSRPAFPGSHGGAIGKYQIMPATARQYWARVFPGEDFDAGRLFDPKVNEALGKAVITDLYNRFHGDMAAIAIGYNSGPGRASTYLTKGPGTMLEAVPDRAARGGYRYDTVPASRDESWLPVETQHYLANARRRTGGQLATGGEPAGHDGNASYSASSKPGDAFSAEVSAEASRTGTGTEEPAAASTGGSLSAASTWRGASVKDLVTELNSNIGEPPKPPGFWNVDRAADQLFELSPARRVDNDLIRAGLYDRTKEMGAEDVMRQTYSANDVASTFIKYGIVKMNPDGTRSVGGPSFNQARDELRAAGGDPDGFRAWLNASRALPKEQEGKTTGFNPFAATELLGNKEAKAMFGKATKTWNAVNDGFLDFMRDSHMYSQKQIDAMKAEGTYVTWRRIQGDAPSLTGGRRPGSTPRGFYRFEGSDGKVSDPISATMDNIRVGIGNALRNQARLHIADNALADPRYAAVIGFKTERSADPNIDEVDNALKEAGFTDDQLENAREAYGNLANQRLDADLKDNEFAYYRDGQRMVAQVNSPELAQLLQRTSSPSDAGIIFKALHTFAAVERAGIVTSPDYGPSVSLFHQLNQFISDPLHIPPFMAPLRGIMHVLKQDDAFQNVLANGGFGSSMAHLDKTILDGTIDRTFDETNTWDRFLNIAKSPKDWPSAALHTAQLVMETAAAAHNVGYAEIAQERGLSSPKAMTMSRKSGLDYYERAGSDIANKIAAISPMFRGKLIGAKQAVEAYEPNNLAEATPGGMAMKVAVTWAIAAAAITLPKIALYVANRAYDDLNNTPEGQRYTDIPQLIRDTHYIFPGSSRVQLRMPAFYALPFGTIPERMMDALYDQHGVKDAGRLFEEFMGEYIPFPNSPLVQGPTEVAFNQNFYTGHPLIPDSVRQRSPNLQYTENTTRVAIALAGVIGKVAPFEAMKPSPMQIDHLVNSFTGTVGMNALRAVDAPFHEQPPSDLKDNIFVQSFVIRHPGMNSQPIQDFYDSFRDFSAQKNDFSFLKKQAVINGQTQVDPSQFNVDEAAAASGFGKVEHALSTQRSLIFMVTHSQTMNVDEKRQAIDNLYSQSVVVAQYGNSMMDVVKEHRAPDDRQSHLQALSEAFTKRYGQLQDEAHAIPNNVAAH